MRRFAAPILAMLLAGALTACGDDDDGAATPAADTPTDAVDDTTRSDETEGEVAGGDESGDARGAFGTATIGDATYSFDQALRCEEDDIGVEGLERELEAQFLGRSDEGRVQLDLYISAFGGIPSHDVSWAGPEGIFGANITRLGDSWTGENDDLYQDAPISVDGSRATGSAVLYDAMTMEESIDIDFDVLIPDEAVACR